MLNYIKVLILFLLTVIIVIVLANNYKDRVNYERSNQDIMGFLSSIKYDEFASYLIEHRDGYIYIAQSSDTSLDSFKSEFKKYLLEEELEKYFVYLDSANYNDNDFDKFKSDYFISDLKDIKNFTHSILAIKDGNVVAILSEEGNTMNIDSVMMFINKYQVIND